MKIKSRPIRKPTPVWGKGDVFSLWKAPLGVSRTPINLRTIKKKDLKTAQAFKRYPRLSMYGDADKDGVPNFRDCRPFDKTRHMAKSSSTLQDLYKFAKSGKAKKRLSVRDSLVRNEEGTVSHRLHRTNVATLDPSSNELSIGTGGWQTVTTKERINKALPSGYRVSQKNYKWNLSNPQGKTTPFDEKVVFKVDPNSLSGKRILHREGEENVQGGFVYEDDVLEDDEDDDYEAEWDAKERAYTKQAEQEYENSYEVSENQDKN